MRQVPRFSRTFSNRLSAHVLLDVAGRCSLSALSVAVHAECDGFVQRGVLAQCRVILGIHGRMRLGAGCSELQCSDARRGCVNRLNGG